MKKKRYRCSCCIKMQAHFAPRLGPSIGLTNTLIGEVGDARDTAMGVAWILC